MANRRLVLASASPRRKELLLHLGVEFEVKAAHVDETPVVDESAEDYVLRISRLKWEAVAGCYPLAETVVLAADTAVVKGREILGKPRDRTEARSMLETLSGASHRVMTALAIGDSGGCNTSLTETEVEFLPLDQRTIDVYLATDEPWDKAGAYGIQGYGGIFVRTIRGSYSNVVGLPLAETWLELKKMGIPSRFEGAPAASGH